MSRIGKNPITIPSDVKVKFEDNSVIVDGPKGSLIVSHDSSLKMKYEDNTLMIAEALAKRDSRVKVFDLDVNQGVYKARALGIEKASSPWK